jgi:hypothetical protein
MTGLLSTLFDWFDRRKNWTPESKALIDRAIYERRNDLPSSQPIADTRYRIVLETPHGNIPAGWKIATVPGNDAEEALTYYAGDSPFERLGGDRIRLRGTDIVRAELANDDSLVQYSDKNIEDWDFRKCGFDNIGSPEYDAQADLFLSSHFTTAVAVDAVRLSVIRAFLDKGIAQFEPDGEHVQLPPKGDGYLVGWKSAVSRFTREGRFERKVVEALRRENRKYGQLRLTILPPLPGLASDEATETSNSDQAATNGLSRSLDDDESDGPT